MKKSRIVHGILLLCIICLWGQIAQAGPRMSIVDGPTFDFGNVQANQTLTHTFILKNVGDSVLRIQQAKGG